MTCRRGADPSLKNKDGKNAVHLACESKFALAMVEALLSTARLSADDIAELNAARKARNAELLAKQVAERGEVVEEGEKKSAYHCAVMHRIRARRGETK